MDRPWSIEDNEVDFEAEGYKCAMRRGSVGAWCGYVGIPSTHPWWGKSHSDEVKPTADMLGPRSADDHGPIDLLCMAFSDKSPEEALSISLCMRVHGGLTYAHDRVPFGEPDGLWWFGFDCAHAGDICPSLIERFNNLYNGDIYRTQSYVVAEVQSLAAQLAKVAQ